MDNYIRKLRDSRILIVDDDEATCELIRRRFAGEQFEKTDIVHTGRDAVEALMNAVAERQPYDLIILDLLLPGRISGQEVYRNLTETLDVAIVIFSGVAARDEIVDALKSGMVEEYITKPADMEVLFLKCERILSRRLFSRQLQSSSRRNQMMFLNILQVMAKVLEAKDPYTKFHSENVAKYARQIGKRVGYSDRQLELIQIAGVLHDFGKIGIKEAVLNKPGSLTHAEYQTVKRHPVIAAAILEPIEELRPIIGDIRHHHEHFAGGGYPDGLEGEAIPLGARILAVADSYDAMTSSRSYHEPMSEEDSQGELVRCKGGQFDPDLVDAFLDVIQENRERRTRIIRLREAVLGDAPQTGGADAKEA